MGSTGRTRSQVLVAVLLALSGAGAILYAGFLPVPPFSDVPIPPVLQLLGIVELAAAVGVFSGRAWGRVLGIVVTAVGLALAVARAVAEAPRSNPPEAFGSLALGVALDAIVLWVLLRRWPARA